MKIEHVAAYFNDLEGAKAFFEQCFSASACELYRNPRTGFCSYFLTFDGGARLEIMQKPEVAEIDNALPHSGYVHTAFGVGSRERVDELTARLRSGGYEIVSGPRTTGDGYYESVVAGFENLLIEITI